MSQQFAPGTSVITKSGRYGTIEPKPYAMPLYELVKFDGTTTNWIRSDLLSHAPVKNGRKREKTGKTREIKWPKSSTPTQKPC